jgi:hypothetical protein
MILETILNCRRRLLLQQMRNVFSRDNVNPQMVVLVVMAGILLHHRPQTAINDGKADLSHLMVIMTTMILETILNRRHHLLFKMRNVFSRDNVNPQMVVLVVMAGILRLRHHHRETIRH